MLILSLQFLQAPVSSSLSSPQLPLREVSYTYKTVYNCIQFNAVLTNTRSTCLCVWTRCAEGTVGDFVEGPDGLAGIDYCYALEGPGIESVWG